MSLNLHDRAYFAPDGVGSMPIAPNRRDRAERDAMDQQQVEAAATELGRIAAARRKKLRLTQQELADLAEVSVRFITSMEAGKSTSRLSGVIKVLDTLGLDLVAEGRRR